MNNDRAKLLTAIKNTVIRRYATLLTHIDNQSKPKPPPKTSLFEMYVYQEETKEETEDVTEIEQKMKDEITYELNSRLYEQESLSLEMEVFTLQQAIKARQNEIQMLQIQLEGEGRSKLAELQGMKVRMAKTQLTKDWHLQKQQKRANNLFMESPKQHVSANSKLNLYPCVRVQVPPVKIPQGITAMLNEEVQNEKKNKKDIIVQKPLRSLSPSEQHIKTKKISLRQTLPYNNKELNQPTMNIYKPTLVRQPNLKGLEQQIDFVSRAWKSAKQTNRMDLAKQYKRELMRLLQGFWETAKA